MSYRTLKRALGETNLEWKCRLLFGACMLVLISGSFWWYGSETDQIVYDVNRWVGKALVNSAMMEAHNNVYVTSDPGMQKANESLTDLLRSRSFTWQVIRESSADAFELSLIRQWSRVDEFKKADDDLGRERPGGSSSEYTYYQPVFAKQACTHCHNIDGGGGSLYLPDMKLGDLMAVVQVKLDTKDTREAQQRNRAWLVTLGIVTVVSAMIAMYLIIRYIIAKPLAHLREVADAVRRGDVEQRAVIHTGDEFEELGAAFNRMLRQLLRQQDELREVNGELDGKIDELAQVNMRLFEMNQVKSDFLATVSHELRTPLNSILGFSDLLAKAKALDEKQKRYATNIERSGRQLLDMINDILDLAKIESGRMDVRASDFDIGAVVLTQCDLARPLSERKHIELDCEIAPGLAPIRQDQGKIEQVLNNLLSNAIKFTPDGGRIHVTARQDRRGDLRLIVADTGVGISESEQVAVFEKFRQGTNVLAGGNAMTREYSGTGLGLSIVRELCRLLGGDVTLESELGRGSEFTVILPWTVSEQTRMESPLADELRQLAKSRSEPALVNAVSHRSTEPGGDI